MKRVSLFLIATFWLFAVQAADIPWHTLEEGNAYWANTLGATPVAPRKRPLVQLATISQPYSDASLALINAALQQQMSELNGDLYRFADSLRYLLIYQSGATPKSTDAYDRAGWWGLTYPVAVRYGLTITAEVDERLDLEKATRAAMLYYRDLEARACDSYKNLNYAFVNGPIALKRDKAYHRVDSLQMVMKALKKLIKVSEPAEADRYAVKSFYASLSYYKTSSSVLIELVVARTGMPEHVFRALNPELKGQMIPARWRIKMPALALANLRKVEDDVMMLTEARMTDDAKAIASARSKALNNLSDEVASSNRTTHKVKSGESLGLLANRFGVGISDLKKWNNLRNDIIYIGQSLIVYASAREPQPVSITTSEQQIEKTVTTVELKEGEYISYKVKSGDTLYSIAKQFPGISPDNLMAWNGIGTKIQPGQKIKILKTEISDYDPKRYPDTL